MLRLRIYSLQLPIIASNLLTSGALCNKRKMYTRSNCSFSLKTTHSTNLNWTLWQPIVDLWMFISHSPCKPCQKTTTKHLHWLCSVLPLSYYRFHCIILCLSYSYVYILQFSIFLKKRLINHRVLPKFGRMFVSVYLCIYVIAIVATPFNSQLWNFGTTFLMWLSKNSFLKCLKKIPEWFPFFYNSLIFLYAFERQLCKKQGR